MREDAISLGYFESELIRGELYSDGTWIATRDGVRDRATELDLAADFPFASYSPADGAPGALLFEKAAAAYGATPHPRDNPYGDEEVVY
jgi:hypothetical protein